MGDEHTKGNRETEVVKMMGEMGVSGRGGGQEKERGGGQENGHTEGKRNGSAPEWQGARERGVGGII